MSRLCSVKYCQIKPFSFSNNKLCLLDVLCGLHLKLEHLWSSSNTLCLSWHLPTLFRVIVLWLSFSFPKESVFACCWLELSWKQHLHVAIIYIYIYICHYMHRACARGTLEILKIYWPPHIIQHMFTTSPEISGLTDSHIDSHRIPECNWENELLLLSLRLSSVMASGSNRQENQAVQHECSYKWWRKF